MAVVFWCTFIALHTVIASATNTDDIKEAMQALERSFLFKSDAEKTPNLDEKLQRFLGTVDKVLRPRDVVFQHDDIGNITVISKTFRVLSKFIKGLSIALINMNDNVLTNFTVTLNEELQSYFQNGSEFDKIMQNRYLLYTFRDAVKSWTRTKPKLLRESLRLFMGGSCTSALWGMYDYLDEYYSKNDRHKLKKILKHLVQHPLDMKEILRNGIEFFVLQRYAVLDGQSKQKIALKFRKLSEKLQSGGTLSADEIDAMQAEANVRKSEPKRPPESSVYFKTFGSEYVNIETTKEPPKGYSKTFNSEDVDLYLNPKAYLTRSTTGGVIRKDMNLILNGRRANFETVNEPSNVSMVFYRKLDENLLYNSLDTDTAESIDLSINE